MAQEQMIMAISAGFKVAGVTGDAVPETMVQLRFLEALEKIAEDPATKLVFPSGMTLQDLFAHPKLTEAGRGDQTFRPKIHHRAPPWCADNVV